MTESEVQEAIGAGAFVSDFLRTQGGINFDSFLQRVGSFIKFVGTLRGPRAGLATYAMSQVRSGYAATVNLAPSWFAPLLREYMTYLDIPSIGLTTDAQSLYANFVKTGKRVKSRNFTFDAAVNPVGSPAGNGTIYRNTKDENGFDIENTFAQTISIECVFDQSNGGTKFKESFRFKGGAANIDNIVIEGSDSDETFPGISSDDSGSYFPNCSFSSMNGTGVTKFDFWTLDVDDLTDWTQDLTVFYQATPGDPVEASLKILGNGVIYQEFSSGNTQFPSDRPMLVLVPAKIAGVTAGALIRVVLGEQVKTYTVTGIETGWTLIPLEISDRSWYKKFAKNDGRFAVQVHGMLAGQINLDNIIVCPMIPFDALWYAPCAGSIPFKVGDSYNFIDTAEDNAIIQRLFVQFAETYLPHSTNSSAITWLDPVFHT